MTDEPTRSIVEKHVRTELVRFVRTLRHRGVAVSADAGVDGARALSEVGLSDRERVRFALRTTLLTDRSDFETFDRLFETFWSRLTASGDLDPSGRDADSRMESVPSDEADSDDEPESDPEAEPPTPAGSVDAESESGQDVGERSTDNDGGIMQLEGESFSSPSDVSLEDDDAVETSVYSATGSVHAVGDGSLPDIPELDDPFTALSSALSGLPGRRYRSGDDRPDLRRMLRESVSTGGTVLSVPKREQQRSAVKALLLIDVSRSVLDTLDRGFLLEFLRRSTDAWRDVRVFFFDETIREVTDAIDADSVTAARRALDVTEAEWGGGTRIGASLARLRERAPETADRRTVAFVISDGLEMGNVEELERELAWLSRRTKRLLWLNPLAAVPGYEPTARGMAAALPYVDGLFAFASPDDVGDLAAQLLRQGPGGRIGYQFDARNDPGANRRKVSTPKQDT